MPRIADWRPSIPLGRNRRAWFSASALIVASVATFGLLEKTRQASALAPPPSQTSIHIERQQALGFSDRWTYPEIVAIEEDLDDDATSYRKPIKTIRFAKFNVQPESTPAPPQAAALDEFDTSSDLKTASVAHMDEVTQYLWEVYERAPTKKDGSGDFTWKDPAAAKRLGMSMPEYVIGGMDPDFREQLYHAGRALDAAGIKWSMLSAFRDDYRQRLASGFKASAKNSLHGGSARTGGYGHGRAIDITLADNGDGAEEVWHWIDAHGAKYGLYRPMPGYDPAHIQSKGEWRKLAVALRETRQRTAASQSKTKVANATAQ